MGCAQIEHSQAQMVYPNMRHRRLFTLDSRRKSTNVADIITENVSILSEVRQEITVKFVKQALKKNQLFAGLTEEQILRINSQLLRGNTNSGSYVFREGDKGGSFFIIEQGTVKIEVGGSTVNILGTGDTFGELSLLYFSRRNASVHCVDNCVFLLMQPSLCKDIIRKIKLRQYDSNFKTVESVPFFQSLTNKQKFYLSNSFQTLHFEPGRVIFDKNEKAFTMFIVRNGRVRIDLQNSQELVLQPYSTFGESSLMEQNTRRGKATALSYTVCSSISKFQIERCTGLNINSLVEYHTKKWALINSKVFQKMSSICLDRINNAFLVRLAQDEKKINVVRAIIICLQGNFNTKGPQTIFNDVAWATNNVPEDIKGEGKYAFLTFKKLDDILAAEKSELVESDWKGEVFPNVIDLSGFNVVKKIGAGTFGEVLVMNNSTMLNRMYAVKCISKSMIREEKMFEAVIQEKRILEAIIFPYIMGFVKCFHDKNYVYFLMEYIDGAEMFEVIREMKEIPKHIAQYFFGCSLLAIEYLHANKIVYRDIKPENMMVDYQGKVSLVDLGTAKILTAKDCERTFTMIGTPHYMAPQIFQGQGYSFEVDNWSLGVLLYEFLCGKLPFGEDVEDDPFKIYHEVIREKVIFPNHVTDNFAKSLILNMLHKNPQERGLTASLSLIKSSPYFEDFNWKALKNEQMTPPYFPKASRNSPGTSKTGECPFLKFKYGCERPVEINEWDESFDP